MRPATTRTPSAHCRRNHTETGTDTKVEIASEKHAPYRDEPGASDAGLVVFHPLDTPGACPDSWLPHEAARRLRSLALDRAAPRRVRAARGQQGRLGGLAVHGHDHSRTERASRFPRRPLG